MQVFSGIIKGEMAGVISTAPFLTNLSFREINMAKTSLPNSAKICSCTDCDKPVKGFGYCQNHFRRFKKYGDPLIRLKVRAKTLAESFLPYVPTAGADECWNRQGTVGHHGYGSVHFQYKNYRASRVSYFLAKGKWPEPMCLHSCDNPRCVNPAHLRAGTHQENMQDSVDRGRRVRPRKVRIKKERIILRGEQCPVALMTDETVADIKQRIVDGQKDQEIADALQVGRSTVSKIRHNRQWRHIPWPPSLAQVEVRAEKVGNVNIILVK